jgi:AraC family transcriptional regulator of adaptative response / DNA-3-methyladenine glycosylase II
MPTISAVVTTGIYCRSDCTARPLAENVRTFKLAAAAEAAGFRACLRCRPYRSAGLIADDSTEFVCRAVQLIIEGVLDDGNEDDLARRLAMSGRQLRRIFNQHLGVTPDQLARSRRAHFARRLLDDSDLDVVDVAFASGFGSLRQFNRDMRHLFRGSPMQLRERRRRADRLAADGGLLMRVPFEPPLDWTTLVRFLSERAVPGVESVQDDTYRRTISLDGAPGVLEVSPGGPDYLLLRAHLPYWEGLIHVVERIGRVFGVYTDLRAAEAHLAKEPTIGPLVKANPGLRVPGAWGPFEVGVHAVLAEQFGLDGAREWLRWLVRRCGQEVPGLTHSLTHLFPAPEVLAELEIPSTESRSVLERVRAFSRAVVSGDIVLDGSVPLQELVASIASIPHISAIAAHHLAMRLGATDAYPASDPDLLASLDRLRVTRADAAAATWHPWRALAAMHLLSHQYRSRPADPA